MLDPIALLQSLTLPAGALTGARIELDGVTGQIRIYNSSSQLVGQIDSSGIITVFDPTTNAYIKLNPASPPVILWRPADFGVHAIGTGSVGTDEQTVPDRARLLIDSPSLDGTDRAQITLEHAPVAGGDIPKVFISDGSAANVGARLEVFGDIEASTAGTGRKGNFLIDQRSIGRGNLDLQDIQASQGPTSGTAALTIATSASIAFDGTQRYRLMLYVRSATQTVNTDSFVYEFYIDSINAGVNQLQQYLYVWGAQQPSFSLEYISPSAPAAGNHQFFATVRRTLGSGTMSVQGASGRPIQFAVDQVGA